MIVDKGNLNALLIVALCLFQLAVLCDASSYCFDIGSTCDACGKTNCTWCQNINAPRLNITGPLCYSNDDCIYVGNGVYECDLGSYCEGNPILKCSSAPGWGPAVGMLVCFVVVLVIIVLYVTVCPLYCSTEKVPTPLLDNGGIKSWTNDKKWLKCIKYTEANKSLTCCFLTNSSLDVIGNTTLVNTGRSTRYFTLLVVSAILTPIPTIVMLAQFDIFGHVFWAPLTIVLILIFPFFFLTPTYILELDKSTKTIYHTSKLGYPFAIWRRKKKFSFEDVHDIEVVITSCGSTPRLEMVFKNGERVILLVDGDNPQVSGMYWRRRSDILNWVLKEDNNFVLEI